MDIAQFILFDEMQHQEDLGENMKRNISVGVSVFGLMFVASTVVAGDRVRDLKGIYRGTLHKNCMESPSGFAEPPNQVFLGEGLRYSDTYTSTAIFGGNGLVTETLHGTTSFMTGFGFQGALSVGTFEDTCRYTMDMHADRSFTLKGSCSGNLPTGPGAPNAVTVADIDVEGQVSEDDRVIIITTSNPDADTLTLTNSAGTVVYAAQRLCATTGTFVRISK